MSEPTYREWIGSDINKQADRKAAELVEELGVPANYERAVALAAIAYLEGARDELRMASAALRGDGE